MAAENPHGRELALRWIKSKTQHIAATGWCTYAGLLATKADKDLDLKEIEQLLSTAVKGVRSAPNRARHTMNGFVIAVGAYVKPLLKQAKAAAQEIGVVSVDMGNTACKVPLASAYIEKIEKMGKVGNKRKTMRCEPTLAKILVQRRPIILPPAACQMLCVLRREAGVVEDDSGPGTP